MVTRSVSNASGLASHFHPLLLVHAEWHDGEVWVSNGFEAVTVAGQEYAGFGAFCQVMAPEENMEMAVDDATVRLAIPRDQIADEIGQDIRGNLIEVMWCGTDKAGGGNVTIGPFPLFAGHFKSRDVVIGPDFWDVTLGVTFGPSARQGASLSHTPESLAGNGGRHLVHMAKYRDNPPAWPER